MRSTYPLITSLAILTGFSSAFSPSPTKAKFNRTVREAETKSNNVIASGFAAAAILFSTFGAESFAYDASIDMFGSDQVVAARSGGRAGGRSSAAARAPRPAASRSQGTTVNNYNVRPASPTVIVSPGYGGYGYGYGSPFGGFGGLGWLGVEAIGSFSREMREIDEQRKLAKTEAELQIANQRQMDLEARLRQLEAQQKGMAPQQYAPPPQQYAPAPVPAQ